MRTKLVLFAAMSAAALLTGASRDGVAAPGSAAGRFVLTSFVQRGRTDVRRNEVLVFKFSAPLRKSSVDLRTLQVVELIPEGRRPVVGARIVEGNVVRLDPRRSQGNYDQSLLPNSTVTERDHEIGFAATAQFEVLIRSGAGKRVLRARDGRPIARRYAGALGTNSLYDDPVPGQPSFGYGGAEVLQFSPPRQALTGLVDPNASIVFNFSEPILPESMRLGETVLVRHTDGTAVAGTLAPVVSTYQNLSAYAFTPESGFGAVADIRVALTTGITDLAGNALRRPFGEAVFKTAPAE